MPPVIPPIKFPAIRLLSAPHNISVNSPSPATSTGPEKTEPPLSFVDHPTVILGPHADAIKASAEKTSGLQREQAIRLAEAYDQADNAGGLQQLYTAKAIEHLFVFAEYLNTRETSLTMHLYSGVANALRDPDTDRRLDRLHEIFRTMEEGPAVDLSTKDAVETLARAGLDLETISRKLAGTRHAAFLKDPAITRSLAPLLIENPAYLDPESERRKYSRIVLLEEIARRIDANKSLTGDALRDLLEQTGFEIPTSIPILVKADKDFDAKVSQWGKAVDSKSPYGCLYTLFRRVNGRGEIWVRDVEASDRNEMIRQWVNRLIGTTHETAHAGQPDFSDRVVSEVLAGLIEQRWRMRNYDIDCWIIARRLNLNVVQFLKLIALWAYRLRPGEI